MGRAFDVVVVGAGISGLASALFLKRAGVARVALASTDGNSAAAPVTTVAGGLLQGGQVDNFTRLTHPFGRDGAATLWRFGDAAFDLLADWCEAEGVPLKRGRRLRLITSSTELAEAEQAVAELAAAGFPSQLSDRAAHPLAPLLRKRVLAVQDDGPRAAWVDVRALLGRLQGETASLPQLGTVRQLASDGPTLSLTLSSGEVVTSELAIVAAHLGIKALLPQLEEALVSVADQWSEVALARPEDAATLAGCCWSAHHTYEWGAFPAGGRLVLGGGRYLRPLAGFEATEAPASAAIAAHLTQQLEKTFTFGAGARVLTTQAGLDIRPCDELPLIGPLPGEGRILVATGYSGAGLTLGFAAGQCLAELILSGRSERLPRRLWPERLRTLES